MPVQMTLLILFLGLNVSILGFIFIPLSAIFLVLKFFGLIVLLNLVYVTVFITLEMMIS